MKHKLITPQEPFHQAGFLALATEFKENLIIERKCPFAPDIVMPGKIQGTQIMISKPCGQWCAHFRNFGNEIHLTCGNETAMFLIEPNEQANQEPQLTLIKP